MGVLGVDEYVCVCACVCVCVVRSVGEDVEAVYTYH